MCCFGFMSPARDLLWFWSPPRVLPLMCLADSFHTFYVWLVRPQLSVNTALHTNHFSWIFAVINKTLKKGCAMRIYRVKIEEHLILLIMPYGLCDCIANNTLYSDFCVIWHSAVTVNFIIMTRMRVWNKDSLRAREFWNKTLCFDN